MEEFNSLKFIKGLAPAADRYNTDPVSDYVSLRNHAALIGLLHQQGGTTGKATVTVLGADDASGTNPVAQAFTYAVGADGAGALGDAEGALTAATSAGFDTTAATDRLYRIFVRASELAAAGKKFVAIKLTEAANDPVSASLDFVLVEPRYSGATQPTAIA